MLKIAEIKDNKQSTNVLHKKRNVQVSAQNINAELSSSSASSSSAILNYKNNSKSVQKNKQDSANAKIKQSIDEKHTEYLTHFENTEIHIIPNLLNERRQLRNDISNITIENEESINKKMDIEEKIDKLTKQIKELKKQKRDYFLQNSHQIFQYFEDKKNISTGKTTYQNVNKLNKFFKIKDTSSLSSPDQATPFSDCINDRDQRDQRDQIDYSAEFNGAAANAAAATRNNNYYKYWKNVNNEILNIQNYVIATDICDVCHNGELIPNEEEGILICNNPKCARFVPYIIDSSKPTNKEPPNEVSYTAYIRLNHFKEILSQFQAKETTQIHPDIIQTIKDRIKKERITRVQDITYDRMREILRKLDLNKYFEHIQYINSILGIKPPIMDEELYKTLCVLFIEIQKPWSIFCPPNRTNFFNYTYTLYQLCVLLDQTQYLPYIPLLKDRTKQLEQDMIWKKVCGYLDWVFYPTI